MIDGYIPLAKPVGSYEIDPWTLKAIKIDDASDLKLLREGTHYGIISLDTAIKARSKAQNLIMVNTKNS